MRNTNNRTNVLLLVVSVAVLGSLIGFSPRVSRVLAQQAQQPGTWINEVDCNGSPELVVITNTSSEPQDLEGWKLESDPPAEESLDLTALAIIWPTQSIMIESGPQAEAAFTWSQKQVFRNNDPADYVRIVDKEGTVRQEVACVAPATATPAPTATVLAATVTPVVGGVVPDGGGRPEAPRLNLISPTVAIAAGSAMVVVSVLLFGGVSLAALWGRRRMRVTEVEEGLISGLEGVSETRSEPEVTIAPEPAFLAAPAFPLKRESSSQQALLTALIVVLVAMALAVFVLQPRDGKRR